MVHRSGVYCTCCSSRSQHTMEPDIGSELRFLPTPPDNFNAPVSGVRWNTAMTFGMEKLEWCVYRWWKILKITECTNMTKTDRWTLLFNSILSNEHHVLHKLLPNTTYHTYSLRNRRHYYTLSNKTDTDERNFITRLLHKDMYWTLLCLAYCSIICTSILYVLF